MREDALYPPVKTFLEAQGYTVKGEVNGCDLVAIRDREPSVIVELKTGFSLPLVFQGIARQGLSDTVYLAVPPFSVRTARRQDAGALPPARTRAVDSPAQAHAVRGGAA